MRPARIALAIVLASLVFSSASPSSPAVPRFSHRGAEIRDIRVLGDEWICVVRDPTEAIAAEARVRGAPLPAHSDPGHWKRLASIRARIDAISAEAFAETRLRDMDAASWSVGGRAVRAVSLWVQSVGAFPDPEYPQLRLERPRLAEYIYLRLAEPLAASASASSNASASGSLGLVAPDGSAHSFTWGGLDAICPSIKHDQEGYLPSGGKIAFFGMWLGRTGAMPTAHLAGRVFHIVPTPVPGQASRAPVFSGTIRFRSRDTDSRHGGAPISGEDLCELDFTRLEKPGKYVIHIPGIGASRPFTIGNEVFGDAFYTTMRGLYHQRCGIALEATHTDWPREACHTRTWAAAYPPDNGEIYGNTEGIRYGNGLYGFRVVENGVEKPLAIDAFTVIRAMASDRILPGVSGGHHDAADYDRRSRHFALVWHLCGIQELFPEHFADGQLDIPESGNGIPDILDEAAIDVDLWMQAQSSSGGVPGWIEQTGHPSRTRTAAGDTSPMYLSLPDRGSSYAFAAAAALLSRGMKAFSPRRAGSYLLAAERAYAWAEDPGNRIRGLSFRLDEGRAGKISGSGSSTGSRTGSASGPAVEMKPGEVDHSGDPVVLYDESPILSARARNDRLLAALQLAAATGKSGYLEDFRSPEPAAAIAPETKSIQGEIGEKTGVDSLLRALPDAIPPFALVTPLFGRVLNEAERGKLASAVMREADILRSGSGSLPYRMLWRPASHGFYRYMAWGNVHGASRAGMAILAWKLTGEDIWREAMIRAADWELGANELGTSMITGLGNVYPVALQHIESEEDGIAEPVPGIAPFSLTYGIASSAWKWQFPAMGLAGKNPVPGRADSATIAEKAEAVDAIERIYPIMRRRFIHPFLEPSQNEFSVMESIAPQAALFGCLIPRGWMPASGSKSPIRAKRVPLREEILAPSLIYPQP